MRNEWAQILNAFTKEPAPLTKAKHASNEKKCSKCGEVKPLSEFYARVDHSPGAVTSHCKPCVGIANAKRREQRKKAEANLKKRVAQRNAEPPVKFNWPDETKGE